MKESAFWNLWPEMESRASAIQVTRQGVLAAALSSALTALISALSVGGYTLYNFLDAFIFAIVAWRIYRLSFSWSIFGLVFFLVERIDGVMRGTIKINLVGWIMAAALCDVLCEFYPLNLVSTEEQGATGRTFWQSHNFKLGHDRNHCRYSPMPRLQVK